jgi:hypothetical protein
MKKISITAFLAVFVLSFAFIAGCGKKGANVDITDNTPVHIKFDVSGKEPGSLDLTFKGKNAKMNITMTKEGQTSNMVMILKEKTMYSIMDQEGKKMGFKSDVTNDESMKDFYAMLNAKDKMKDMEKTGSEDVLGYKCDIYKDKKGDLLSIFKERVPLKIVSKDVSMTATVFEPDIKIADDAFEPPKDIEFMDMNSMQQHQQQELDKQQEAPKK